MSATYAFIREHNGEVAHTMTRGLHLGKLDSGAKNGSFIVIDITSDKENEARYITDKYFIGSWVEHSPEVVLFEGSWHDKPTKPGKFYNWTFDGWVFDAERFLSDIRTERDKLLKESDWTQIPDSPLSAAIKESWATYRQQLRDFPATITTETTLEELVWPTAP